MWIPRHWARVSRSGRTALGWSDASVDEARAMAHERLSRLLALGDESAPEDWDYYPATPPKEEILETRPLAGVTALVTRNRAGAEVLNVERVAFVDVDLPEKPRGFLGGLFGKPRGPDAVLRALGRVEAWCESNRARMRAYRTAGGLRLLRLDALVDPEGEACQGMFTALGADPRYAGLCRVQKSFRARLTPKPWRVGCPAAPGSHPRAAGDQAAFRAWLEGYKHASAERAVCTVLGEYGSAAPITPTLAVAAYHEARTLRAEAALA